MNLTTNLSTALMTTVVAVGHQRGPPITHEQQLTMTIVVAILGVWSTTGNLLTILAILSFQKMRSNKTNIFILSLAFSDLFSGLIASPLWLYRRTWGFHPWQLGQFACKFYWGLDEMASYCTAMHIASFAIWRYTAVKFPNKFAKIKLIFVLLWIAIMWIVAIIFGGLIYGTFFESVEKPQDGGVYSSWPMCSIKLRDGGIAKHKMYYTFSTTTFLFLPMLILIFTSFFIAYEIIFRAKFKSKSTIRRERRAVTQLTVIAISFIIGYVPLTVQTSWTIRVANKPPGLDYWWHVGGYFCLRISECINPIMYNVVSNQMRKSSKAVIKKLCCCVSDKVVCLSGDFSATSSAAIGSNKT